MTTWKNLFGVAAILFGVGYVIRGIHPAQAFNSPSVSVGENPIESHYFICNNSNVTVLINGTAMDYIVTDILMYSGVGQLKVDQQVVLLSSDDHTLQSGIKVGPGQTLSCTNFSGGPAVTVSGYYAHP